MRNQAPETFAITPAVAPCLSQDASNRAHLRLDPILLASATRYGGELAMFGSAIVLILQYELKAGADEDLATNSS